MRKNIFYIIILSIVAVFFVKIDVISAADCASVSVGGDYTVSTSCTFAGTVNGVDNGNLTINAGVTLTINAGQTIVWNSGKTLTINGSIAINKGGGAQLKKTNLWVTDLDDDNYPSTATPIAQDSQPANGKRRSDTDFTSKWSYTSQMQYDYADSSATVYPGTVCNGDCSVNSDAGTCVAAAAGENGQPVCKRCNGSSLAPVNVTDNTEDAEGTNLCTTCQACSSGACTNSANTNWGANLYSCTGAAQRCYSGVCRTCDGYLYSDGCAGCAGQGGNACWRTTTDSSLTCTAVCQNYGNCIPANWNDTTTCTVGMALLGQPAYSCTVEDQPWSPSWLSGKAGWSYGYRNAARGQGCDQITGYNKRICVCQY